MQNAGRKGGVDEVIGDEATGGGYGLSLNSQGRARGDFGAQHIAGGNGGNRVSEPLPHPLDDQPALCSLTGTRWPEEKNNQVDCLASRQRTVPVDFRTVVFNKDDNECMSSRNGDKARYGRLRKKKIARRVLSRELRKAVLRTAPATPVVV